MKRTLRWELKIPTKTEVLIVGAGPTGMALAIALQQAGVDYVLIDKLSQGQNTSRAAVIHAHTLEMLETLGVSRELSARGLKLAQFSLRDRNHTLVQLRFDTLPSDHNYLLMVPQDVTERVLNERLTSLGGSIHRNVTATGADQNRDNVTVTLATPSGETKVTARYVVGADGMHSIVRTSAGIEFEGGSYADSFVLADVKMDWSLGNSEVSLFFSEGGLLVVAPLPNGIFRIVATLENAPEQLGLADVQRLVDARGPTTGRNVVRDIAWSSRFRIHHRLAKSYHSGGFFVMGDAAHVHSPAGGQGMNVGMVDAIVLGRLLTNVLRDDCPESALNAYESMRRPAARQVLATVGMLTGIATARGAATRAARNALLSLVNAFPPARRRLLMNLSGLSRKPLAVVPDMHEPSQLSFVNEV
jgi:2-polyprenyl-6-methoxyphenol hydroxylase-like FAD-dependent oxidoreductase